MKRFAALLLGLLLLSPIQAQLPIQSQLPPAVSANATAVNEGRVKANTGKQDVINLDVGEWHVFKFALTKPFVVEADTVFSTDEPPAYHDETGKAVVVFGAKDGPEKVQVRVIQENKTVYRALVTISQAAPVPHVSPYIARVQKAYQGDKGATAADVTRLAGIYSSIVTYSGTAATGKAIWDKIDEAYKVFSTPVLQQTRREIGVILGEQTTALYGVQLTTADRKAYRVILQDILAAVQTLQQLPTPTPGPGPTPGPVGQHKIYMVVVTEATAITPAQADMLDDAALMARMKDKGHKYLLVDKDAIDKLGGGVPPKLKPYLDLAKGKQLPFVIMVDLTTGQELLKEPLPATAADVIKMLERAGG